MYVISSSPPIDGHLFQLSGIKNNTHFLKIDRILKVHQIKGRRYKRYQIIKNVVKLRMFRPTISKVLEFRFSLATDIFPCRTIKCISWNSCTKYWVKHCLSFNQPLPNTHNHMQYDENFSCFQQIFVNKNILFFVIVIVQKFKSSECFLPFMFCVFVC